MAPAVTSPKTIMMGRNGLRLGSTTNSREATPTASKQLSVVAKGDAELASVFKSDLTDIRNLVTCSICDQLLYEPWTLGCGHTYCYSCLCNWFVPNKRKKTCPECRATVKQMPAPAFLVKQMVEIFIKRSELMPSDESIDQHQKKRAEEIADVDKDRNGAEGLFKGTFPTLRRELIYDEGDGVYRCPRCLTEHEGGPTCANCDLAVEPGYDLSDMDDDFDPEDLDNLEVDLDDAEFGDGQSFLNRAHFHFGNMRGHMHAHALFNHPFHFHNHHEHDSEDSDSESSEGETNDEDDEDDDSLREFIVSDDPQPHVRPNPANPREPINISDDDSDEGGAVSNRRRRRVGNRPSGRSSPSVVSLSSSSVSEADEAMLQQAGWSPLDHGNDSDPEIQAEYPGYPSEEENADGSDTETIGHGASSDESGSDRSETPRYELAHYGVTESSDGEDEDGSDAGRATDHDGDTEMSASPSIGQYRSGSVSTDVYGYEIGLGGNQSRGASVSSAYGYGAEDSGISRASRSTSVDSEQYRNWAEDLGQANEIHEVEDDSSDSSIVPPPRRRPRGQYPYTAQVQNYDPRISMIFAEHQQIRGAQDPQTSLAQLDDQMYRVPVVEPASRTRRSTAYRGQPLRRIDPLRSSRSPSATRVISSSNRNGRVPPQYQRRN